MDLMGYVIEIEWLMTWFPVRANAAIDTQRTRAGTLRYKSSVDFPDGVFGTPNGVGNILSIGSDVAGGQINVDLGEDGILSVTLHAGLGAKAGTPAEIAAAHRKKSLIAQPASRIPFMLNVVGPSGDQGVAGTALSLHGVISTGSRPIDSIAKHWG